MMPHHSPLVPLVFDDALEVIVSCINLLALPRGTPSERRGEVINHQPGRRQCLPGNEEGTFATKHNAGTGQRGYHNVDI